MSQALKKYQSSNEGENKLPKYKSSPEKNRIDLFLDEGIRVPLGFNEKPQFKFH